MAYAENTLRSRSSQRNKYIGFCNSFELVPLHANEDQVCNYITYLTDTLQFSSIQNYISGLNYFHKLYTCTLIDMSSFLVTQTLGGANKCCNLTYKV